MLQRLTASETLIRITSVMDYDKPRSRQPMTRLAHSRRKPFGSGRTCSVHISRAEMSLVIDLGCGTGRFSELLAAHFSAQVIGIDPSLKMLDQARG